MVSEKNLDRFVDQQLETLRKDNMWARRLAYHKGHLGPNDSNRVDGSWKLDKLAQRTIEG